MESIYAAARMIPDSCEMKYQILMAALLAEAEALRREADELLRMVDEQKLWKRR